MTDFGRVIVSSDDSDLLMVVVRSPEVQECVVLDLRLVSAWPLSRITAHMELVAYRTLSEPPETA